MYSRTAQRGGGADPPGRPRAWSCGPVARGPDPGQLASSGCTVAKGAAGASGRRPGLFPCPPPTCTGRRGPPTRPAAFVCLRGHPGADTGGPRRAARVSGRGSGPLPGGHGRTSGQVPPGHGPDPTEGPKSSRRPTPAWGATGARAGRGRAGGSRSQPQAGEEIPRAGAGSPGRGLDEARRGPAPASPGPRSGVRRCPGSGTGGAGAGRTPVWGGRPGSGGGAPHRDRCLRRSRCRSSGPAGTGSQL